ncbi:MAK10-like protein [Tanacetum coccineum]
MRTINLNLTSQILKAQAEAMKEENIKEENLCGMNKEFKTHANGTLCIKKWSWVPQFGGLTDLIMNESYNSKHSIHPGSDKINRLDGEANEIVLEGGSIEAWSDGDANPICTLEDYSRPSHEGYKNTIELLEGNNVVPLLSDTIRLVQNRCSFHGLQSEDPNQHLKDSLKLMHSLDLDCEIDRADGGKLCNKNADESWEIIENLALYDHEGWNDSKEFVKLVKVISTSQTTSKMPDQRLLELKVQINFLLKGSQPTPRPSSTHVPQAYVEAVSSNPHPRNQSEPPKKNPFTFPKRTSPYPQTQATTFEDQWPVYEAILNKKITRKEDIGGNFEIPYNIGASHSYIYPLEIAEDALVDVAGFVYPVDFVILDIKEDEKRPFILGTPFLTTAKAVIKFDKGTITLRSGKCKISFHKIPESLCKIKRGIKNDIEPISPTMTVNKLVLK